MSRRDPTQDRKYRVKDPRRWIYTDHGNIYRTRNGRVWSDYDADPGRAGIGIKAKNKNGVYEYWSILPGESEWNTAIEDIEIHSRCWPTGSGVGPPVITWDGLPDDLAFAYMGTPLDTSSKVWSSKVQYLGKEEELGSAPIFGAAVKGGSIIYCDKEGIKQWDPKTKTATVLKAFPQAAKLKNFYFNSSCTEGVGIGTTDAGITRAKRSYINTTRMGFTTCIIRLHITASEPDPLSPKDEITYTYDIEEEACVEATIKTARTNKWSIYEFADRLVWNKYTLDGGFYPMAVGFDGLIEVHYYLGFEAFTYDNFPYRGYGLYPAASTAEDLKGRVYMVNDKNSDTKITLFEYSATEDYGSAMNEESPYTMGAEYDRLQALLANYLEPVLKDYSDDAAAKADADRVRLEGADLEEDKKSVQKAIADENFEIACNKRLDIEAKSLSFLQEKEVSVAMRRFENDDTFAEAGAVSLGSTWGWYAYYTIWVVAEIDPASGMVSPNSYNYSLGLPENVMVQRIPAFTSACHSYMDWNTSAWSEFLEPKGLVSRAVGIYGLGGNPPRQGPGGSRVGVADVHCDITKTEFVSIDGVISIGGATPGGFSGFTRGVVLSGGKFIGFKSTYTKKYRASMQIYAKSKESAEAEANVAADDVRPFFNIARDEYVKMYNINETFGDASETEDAPDMTGMGPVAYVSRKVFDDTVAISARYTTFDFVLDTVLNTTHAFSPIGFEYRDYYGGWKIDIVEEYLSLAAGYPELDFRITDRPDGAPDPGPARKLLGRYPMERVVGGVNKVDYTDITIGYYNVARKKAEPV